MSVLGVDLGTAATVVTASRVPTDGAPGMRE